MSCKNITLIKNGPGLPTPPAALNKTRTRNILDRIADGNFALWASLVFFIGSLYAMHQIARTDDYYYQSMDSLPLSILTVLFVWPQLYISLSLSLLNGVHKYRQRRPFSSTLSFVLSISCVISLLFGFRIYDELNLFRINKTDTRSIFYTKDSQVRYYSKQILDQRQDELLIMLRQEGESLSDAWLKSLLIYLKNSDDPLVQRYRSKLDDKKLNEMYMNQFK